MLVSESPAEMTSPPEAMQSAAPFLEGLRPSHVPPLSGQTHSHHHTPPTPTFKERASQASPHAHRHRSTQVCDGASFLTPPLSETTPQKTVDSTRVPVFHFTCDFHTQSSRRRLRHTPGLPPTRGPRTFHPSALTYTAGSSLPSGLCSVPSFKTSSPFWTPLSVLYDLLYISPVCLLPVFPD